MMLAFQSLARGRVFSPQVKIYLNLKSNFIMDKASFQFFFHRTNNSRYMAHIMREKNLETMKDKE